MRGWTHAPREVHNSGSTPRLAACGHGRRLDRILKVDYRWPTRVGVGPYPTSRTRSLMDWLLSVKLIRLFNFYLALCFLIGTVLRVKQYLTILKVARTFPGRWPKLLK